MTKSEAVIALNAGKRIRHRYFGLNEFVYLKDGIITSEDGVKHPDVEFWSLRIDPAWEDDWEIIPDNIIEIEVRDGKKAIQINCRDAGKQYVIEEIELGAGPQKKAVVYPEGMMLKGAHCRALVKDNGKLKIIL